MSDLYINCRVLSSGNSGVSRYLKSILSNENFRKSIFLDCEYRGFRGHLWEQCRLSSIGSKNSVLWSPSNTGPLFCKAKHIVTVHDLATIDHPEWTNFKFHSFYKFLLPKLMYKVDHIIAVSSFTKSRIIEVCGIEPDKVSVIHNGVEDVFRHRVEYKQSHLAKSKLSLCNKRYVLSVSSIEPRKNIKGVLAAWAKIVDTLDSDIWLVLVGKENNKVFAALDLPAIPPRVMFTGFVSDEFLPALYQGAELFIYVPFYEGFGLPPLEAMASGTPVITSNCSSLPEVTGSSALLVNPYSIDDISDAIISMLSSSDLRTRYSQLGYNRSLGFSWEKSAKGTLEILAGQ